MTSRSFWPVALVLSLSACTAGPPPAGPAAPGPGAAPPSSDPNAPVSSPPGEPGAVAGEPGEPGEPAGQFPGSTWKVRDLGVSVPDEWRACSAASDCKLVQTTCCDQCNGGKAVAVNASFAKQVEAKYPRSCQGVACTERGCATRAACQGGRCVMEWMSASP